MSAAKIPATIVTGFLGAGKTTLIRHVLENAGDRRLALVINEFGDVGVDGPRCGGRGECACRGGRALPRSWLCGDRAHWCRPVLPGFHRTNQSVKIR